ncbi:MAG: hypothetical protein EXQ55_05610 [Acidobacteria bacterium]|nr:hypothetical protein [Acidobacteriota bacterium]
MLTKPKVIIWAVTGTLAATLYLLATVKNASPVAEDAAILMRYALHVGRGLGYRWNVGEPPVDGATDWLGTTMLGALYAGGVPLEAGPRLLAGAAHALTVGLVVVIALEGFAAPIAVALASAAFVAVGPARAYVEAGFLTPLFALGTLAGWACIVFATRPPIPDPRSQVPGAKAAPGGGRCCSHWRCSPRRSRDRKALR